MTIPAAALVRLQSILEGQYRIDRELGRGANSQVFVATDLRHGRTVALKVLPPELATPAAAERFLREIRITATLQHPNVLPLLDSGAADGLCWYVMPHVVGESLRERLGRGWLPIRDAVRIASEIAQALAYAHEREIIHRDIKPENVMLSAGHAIVMDFGLARALGAGASSLTVSGLPLGTPAYMSPEQIMGQETVDARADLYGLGCVLFEMVTGRPPHIAPSATQVMRLHLSAPTPVASASRPDIPAPLDAILTRLMARRAEDRYARALDLLPELEMVAALATIAELGGPAERKAAEKSGWRKWFGG